MSAALYNADILRLAAEMPFAERLAAPMGSAEKRSAVCGSRVTVDVDLDGDGRVAAVGMLVRACALGQAAASVLAGSVVGQTPDELAAARDALAAWLAGGGAPSGWPGLAVFEPARAYPARHPSIRLAFEAAAEAAATASARA